MKKFLILCMATTMLTACYPAQKIAKVDTASGLIQSKEVKIATVQPIKSTAIDLKKYKEFVFVTSSLRDKDFAPGQVKEIAYFNKVAKHSDLEAMVIENKLQDKVLSLNNQIGLSRLASYKPFLWIRASLERGPGEEKTYARLVVTRMENAEDVFEAKVELVSGSSDDTVWYPLFNALITWINQNK